MEIAGYSGWGLGLIVAVLAFNLAMIPLYFLVNFLRRAHDLGMHELQTFLHVLDEERAGAAKRREEPEELQESIDFLRRELEQASHQGPLWGRKHISSAKLWISQLEALDPELCGLVAERMRR